METKHTHSETCSTHESFSKNAHVIIFSTHRPVRINPLAGQDAKGFLQIVYIANASSLSVDQTKNTFELVKHTVFNMLDVDIGFNLPQSDDSLFGGADIRVFVNIEILKSGTPDVEIVINPADGQVEMFMQKGLSQEIGSFLGGENRDTLRFSPQG
jgi:hypothetical protein